ncbi:hypothetical protein PISMIDRAFT_139277 [Pisolithus microcarpus 441]|uniref:Uncharacterized protein n=1 Tax=Pisolithus microcarpus 441 TaxID=765257 RepID=A0A0D0AGR2_9AGAM|nr:hypothetical protein PISMIDRAFT_139277 [Pisolithus microcarpus 441]
MSQIRSSFQTEIYCLLQQAGNPYWAGCLRGVFIDGGHLTHVYRAISSRFRDCSPLICDWPVVCLLSALPFNCDCFKQLPL